ncbi:MAG: hypothetical protein CMA03_06165 [Euryarchaeota archaeon]|nr:hypothetical protein [Euryarchaeota archaeon]|tara:strand:- start:1142 stop:1903 length:762 start_codon:yes stop_codon:yes gene_type:complete
MFMHTNFVWSGEHNQLPEHQYVLFALPGVGNVGKLLIDSLNDACDSEEILKLQHPDLPPHATMKDGILTPPHLYLNKLRLPNNQILLTLSGEIQPLVPRGQYEMAEDILNFLRENNTQRLILLAGLSSDAGCEKIHVVVADHETKKKLNDDGIIVSETQPEGGVIGMCGLLGSLAPSRGVSSVTVIAETFGTSVDTVAAERLRLSLINYFGFELPITLDRTEELAKEIMENYSEGPGALISKELMMPDDSFYQ